MNKVNTNDQLNRMKSLMNYGLQTESKKAPYSAVEYQKVGADGKVYGIVREGTKYYIKTAPNKQNLIKEDFGYIGGFRNRKDNEYTSYANAQKNFDMKMMSLKEAYNNPTFNVESWDLNKKELVVTEASDKMKGEILRERQIMKNAMKIMEKKTNECGTTKECDMPGFKCPTGPKGAGVNQPYTEDGGFENPDNINKESKVVNGKPVNEEEVLGWNRKSPDYMDKSHGTEIGDSAPFDDATARNIDDQDKKVTKTGEMKNGVVENHGVSMHDTDNQNKPEVGVGEGPSDDNNKPFDAEKGKQIDEAVDGLDTPPVDDAEGGEEPMGDEPMGDEAPMDGAGAEGEPVDTGIGDEAGLGDDEGLGDDDFEDDELDDDFEDEDPYDEDLENRLDSLEDKLNMIMDKLGVEEPAVDADDYEDDDLFGDEGFEDEDELGDEDFEDEEGFGEDDLGGTPEDEGDFEDDEYENEDEDEYPMESRRRRGVQIFETKAFKRAMRKQAVNEDDERQSKISKEIGRMMRTKGGFKKSRALRGNRNLDDLSDEELDKLSNTKYESTNRYGNRINEEGMTPFTDAGRVPSGNMNKLDDFGKHPAYQKVVMDLPPKDMKEFPGNYDMNDDSVRNDNPYGEKIGDGAPFEIDPEAIDNAIAEAFDRLKKKGKRG